MGDLQNNIPARATLPMDQGPETRLRSTRKRKMWPHKLWMKLFQARRKLRRALNASANLTSRWAREKQELVDRYEEQVAYERARADRIQEEMLSRFVQFAGKQQPIMWTDLEQGVLDPRFKAKPDPGKPEDALNTEAYQRFVDAREVFWAEGEEDGRSPAEIKEKWEEIKDSVIDDVMGGAPIG